MATEVTSFEDIPYNPTQTSATQELNTWLDASVSEPATVARRQSREQQTDYQRFQDRLVRKLGKGVVGDSVTLESKWAHGRVTQEQVMQTLATLASSHGIETEIIDNPQAPTYEEIHDGDQIRRIPHVRITGVSDTANKAVGRHRAR